MDTTKLVRISDNYFGQTLDALCKEYRLVRNHTQNREDLGGGYVAYWNIDTLSLGGVVLFTLKTKINPDARALWDFTIHNPRKSDQRNFTIRELPGEMVIISILSALEGRGL